MDETENDFWKRIEAMRLPYLRFSTTIDCNGGCAFCHNEKQIVGKRGEDAKLVDSFLSISDIEYIADFFKERFNEVKFTGGEPTITKNLAEIIGVFTSRGYNASMTTNAFIFNDDMQKNLKDAGLGRVNVSLPTIDEVQHGEFFSNPGYLRSVLKNLEDMAVNYKGSVKINFMAFDGQNVPSQLVPITELSGRLRIPVSFLQTLKEKDVTNPLSEKIMAYLDENVGIIGEKVLPDNFYTKKLVTFKNNGVWEIDDFRRQGYRNDAFDNYYCKECNVQSKCVEGPYALRISFDGTIRSCLARDNNIVKLKNGGYFK